MTVLPDPLFSPQQIRQRAIDALRQGDYPRAARLFRRHLDHPEAVWQDERCLSMLCLAACSRASGEPALTERWLLRACAEQPDSPRPWSCAAAFYRSVGHPQAAALCDQRAAACENVKETLMESGCARGREIISADCTKKLPAC